MEYAEKAIFDIQSIFAAKLGGGYGTLKKAMEIEDYLYKDSLFQIGEQVDHVWESLETLQYYKASIDRVKKLMHERSDKDTDWVKLFNIKDVKNFRQQLSRAVHTQVKRKAPVDTSTHFSIPAPNNSALPAERQHPPPTATAGKSKGLKVSKNIGKKQHKTKKAKTLETENRQRQFLQEWEASFNAVDSSAPAANTTSTPSTAALSGATTSDVASTSSSATSGRSSSSGSSSNNHTRTSPAAEKKQQQKQQKQQRERERENMPMMTQLMHQDSTAGVSVSLPSDEQDQGEGGLLVLDTQGDGEDSFFATAKLENASGWGHTSSHGSHSNSAGDRHLSSSSSGWATAIDERKSQVELTEAHHRHQSSAQDAPRLSTEETFKGASSSVSQESAAAAAVAEELRVAREREREKREREMQSQNVFMDGDHEALGGEMYW